MCLSAAFLSITASRCTSSRAGALVFWPQSEHSWRRRCVGPSPGKTQTKRRYSHTEIQKPAGTCCLLSSLTAVWEHRSRFHAIHSACDSGNCASCVYSPQMGQACCQLQYMCLHHLYSPVWASCPRSSSAATSLLQTHPSSLPDFTLICK